MSAEPGLFVQLEALINEMTASAAGLELRLSRGPLERSKRSYVLRAESTERLGEMILWESGEVALSMADVASGEVEQQHWNISGRVGLEHAIKTLLAWVAP